LSAQGVIAESTVSFKITWDNPGNGQQPKWDQNKQSIELHQTDVYPDLEYVSAFAAPIYTKYTSGSLLNDLIVEINKVIDSKLASKSDKKKKVDELYLNSGPSAPKQLGAGQEEDAEEDDELYLKAGPSAPKQLGAGQEEDAEEDDKLYLKAGPSAPKQLGAGQEEETQIKADDEKPAEIIDTNKEVDDEPNVKTDDQELVTATTTIAPEKRASSAYTVTVYGDKLRFLEGQEGRGAYSAGIKFLYKVSNNLTKQVAGDKIDNREKIWAEVSGSGLLSNVIRFEFAEFDEIEFKFGGNLLAQVFPSIELSFTPDPNSVYSKEKPELDIADVIKATNITLGTKTTSEIKSLQKQIQKEIESREPVEKQKQPGKQSASIDNK